MSTATRPHPRRRVTDQHLAFIWHLTEFLGLLGLVGLIWSYRHLSATAESDREVANHPRRRYTDYGG